MTIDQNKVHTFRYSFLPFLSPMGHGLIRGHRPLGSSRKGRDVADHIDAKKAGRQVYACSAVTGTKNCCLCKLLFLFTIWFNK